MKLPQPVVALRRLDVGRVMRALQRLEQAVDVLADQPLVVGIAQQLAASGAQARVAVGEIGASGESHGTPRSAVSRAVGEADGAASALARRSSTVFRMIRPSSLASSMPPQRLERRIDAEAAGERCGEIEVAPVDAELARTRERGAALREQGAEERRVARARRAARRALRARR